MSGNGTVDQAESLIVRDRLEKSYQNKGQYEKHSDSGRNNYRSKSSLNKEKYEILLL